MRGLIRDPLVLFLLGGISLFAAYSMIEGRQQPVNLSVEMLAVLEQDYERLTGSQPSKTVRDQLIRDHYQQEVLFREALRSSMVKEDPEIREVLIEKMQESVAEDLSEPATSQLALFYAANIDRYYQESNLSFQQHVEIEEPADPLELLTALQEGRAPSSQPSRYGLEFSAYGDSMVRGLFGETVLASLLNAQLNVWFGPVPSIDGWHFFNVSGRQARKLLDYSLVEEQVRADYRVEQLQQRVDGFVSEFEQRYPLKLGAP